MIKRWHHGHSLVAGLAAGAALTQGVFGAFLLVVGGFSAGLVAALVWRQASRFIGYVHTWLELRTEKQAAKLAELRLRSRPKPNARFGSFPPGY